jgi:polyferredoxin
VAAPEQCAAERRRALVAEADARAWQRQLLLRWAATIIWPLIGTVIVVLSARTSNPSTGLQLLVGGQLVGYGGFLLSLVFQFVTAMQRGDW